MMTGPSSVAYKQFCRMTVICGVESNDGKTDDSDPLLILQEDGGYRCGGKVMER